MLKRIKISKLFNSFDYDIDLKPGGLTILTGPNGYEPALRVSYRKEDFAETKLYAALIEWELESKCQLFAI